MRAINVDTKAKIRVRGRGSGHLEVQGTNEAPVPLMVAVTSERVYKKHFSKAVQMTLVKLKEVQVLFNQFCQQRCLGSHISGNSIWRFGEMSEESETILADLVAENGGFQSMDSWSQLPITTRGDGRKARFLKQKNAPRQLDKAIGSSSVPAQHGVQDIGTTQAWCVPPPPPPSAWFPFVAGNNYGTLDWYVGGGFDGFQEHTLQWQERCSHFGTAASAAAVAALQNFSAAQASEPPMPSPETSCTRTMPDAFSFAPMSHEAAEERYEDYAGDEALADAQEIQSLIESEVSAFLQAGNGTA